MKQRKTIHLIKEVSQGKTRPFLIKSGSAWIDNLLPKAISILSHFLVLAQNTAWYYPDSSVMSFRANALWLDHPGPEYDLYLALHYLLQ